MVFSTFFSPALALVFPPFQEPVSGNNPVRSSADLTTLERFLYQAELADGETALHLELDDVPTNDNIRFSLGVVQFFRAIENVGQALFEYGALSEVLGEPVIKLKVPQNNNPSELSYQEFGRLLDAFRNDLLKAERTLSSIQDDDVKIPIKLARVALHISNNESDVFSLMSWLKDMRIDVPAFLVRNPELEIHFDRGDVAWLRAYCHGLCALIEIYRALDEETGFEKRLDRVFPRIKPTDATAGEDWAFMLRVKDTTRLRIAREHLVAVCQLNKETWKHIRMETDNDFEWLSKPGQTDQLGLPITDEQIDSWLTMMGELEGLFQGERLIPGEILRSIFPNHGDNEGLNVRKLLDNPPKDLFNVARLQNEGIDKKYIERDSGKPNFDGEAIFAVLRIFDGPFGFAQAVRLN